MSFQCLKGDYNQQRNQLLTCIDSNRARGNSFKLKEWIHRLDVREKFSQREIPEVLVQVTQRNCRCSNPRSIQSQVGWGPGQQSSAWSSSWHLCPWQVVGTWWSLRSLPTPTILWLLSSLSKYTGWCLIVLLGLQTSHWEIWFFLHETDAAQRLWSYGEPLFLVRKVFLVSEVFFVAMHKY